MIRRLTTRKRVLSGWTVTGDRRSHGAELPPLAGGRVDWSVPRCEPDNRLHVRTARLLVAVLPVLVVAVLGRLVLVPAAVVYLPRLADWMAVHRLNLPVALLGLTGAALALAGVLAMVDRDRPVRPVRRARATARIAVTVAPPGPGTPGMPLEGRVLDSRVMLPAAPAAGDVSVPGRWSA